MSITKDELKEFVENTTIKDIRKLNTLIIDLLTDEQIQNIENFFEKSLRLKQRVKKKSEPKPTPKKKEPTPRQTKQTSEEEEVFRTQDYIDEDSPKEEEEGDELEDFEFDADVKKPKSKNPLQSRPLNDEEFASMEREIQRQRSQPKE